VTSGVGVLLAVTTAAAGLLIGGRCAMFFAALASLAVLGEQIYDDWIHDNFAPLAYATAGMLGASFFTIALLAYILAKRSEQITQIARQQQQTISNLEGLNQSIIQHLQSGIIIVDSGQSIQMLNEAVLRLLNVTIAPMKLIDISEQLTVAFLRWQSTPEQNSVLLLFPHHVEIYARFNALLTDETFFYMIILEDGALYNQRVQQSKLA
jgi:two-component system sensor histidine kinase PilS (NtrC family)